ncbi:hypothetical protein BAUCODRAFT_429140 [Baudoinia panamericana UAMH 10762]|uniref:Uncharacterized protein n=1 Tax=Baudoinia panamericana (strain UAMH 10762) TaxID=717646 RepID=M2NGV5_BAUPA|nr:uncharacterized protein BAUCODRAFT_429140 [Baudoinia panamericana UAMH 10762]EMC98529.1 hypothetical protein BAUCODRAFT_429140 [Baudoinia panamericana UAMH 10762]
MSWARSADESVFQSCFGSREDQTEQRGAVSADTTADVGALRPVRSASINHEFPPPRFNHLTVEQHTNALVRQTGGTTQRCYTYRSKLVNGAECCDTRVVAREGVGPNASPTSGPSCAALLLYVQ